MAAPLRAGSPRRSSARRSPLDTDDPLARALAAPGEGRILARAMHRPEAPEDAPPDPAPTDPSAAPRADAEPWPPAPTPLVAAPEVSAPSSPAAAAPEAAPAPVAPVAEAPPDPVVARLARLAPAVPPRRAAAPAPVAPAPVAPVVAAPVVAAPVVAAPVVAAPVVTAPVVAPPVAQERPEPAAAPSEPVPEPVAARPTVASAASELAPDPELGTAAAGRYPAAEGPRAQLEMALTDLAEVFAVYPFRSGMPACAHCVTDDDLRLLGRAPARIPSSVLDRYVTKSMITWGDAVDFKRLLPEILTRTCNGQLATPEALVGARLRRAGWLEWPAAEAPAVRRTLRAAWLTTLASGPEAGRVPATTRLGLIVSAEDDLSPYLDLWEDRLEAPGNPTARLYAVLHLADLLAPLARGGRRRLSRSYPLARRGVVGQLDQWLRQPMVVRRLAHAADALADTPQGAQVALAREGLASLKTER